MALLCSVFLQRNAPKIFLQAGNFSAVSNFLPFIYLGENLVGI